MTKRFALLDQFGREIPPMPQLRRRARATYDAIRDSDETRNYWVHADGFDSDKSNNKTARDKLRRHSRYERGSNPYYAGMMDTHANMVWGVGPTLRITSARRSFNQRIERDFYRWWKFIGMQRKGWCQCHAKNLDGEGFGVLINNPAIENDVQLDVLLVEADQVSTPFLPFFEAGYIDGIRFDQFNNILWYDVLPSHPGGGSTAMSDNPIRVPKNQMLHWFKLIRPGGHRGIPSLTPSLNLGAMSRRFREATIAKAETQADYTVFIKTDIPSNILNEEEALESFDTTPIDKRMMTVLPNQYDPVQLESDSPNAQYADFHRTQISEMGRPLNMPYNLSAGDSSTYSFASGKMDLLAYRAAIEVERQECNDLVLDPLFREWFREWAIVNRLRDVRISHEWAWPAHPIIDAVAEATAADIELKNGMLTPQEYITRKGGDWDDHLAQQSMAYFGEITPESLDKMRLIILRTNFPDAFEQEAKEQVAARPVTAAAMRKELRGLKARLSQLESEFVKK